MADYSNPAGVSMNLPAANANNNNSTTRNSGASEMIDQTLKVGSTVTSVYSSSATAAKGVLVAPESLEISNVGGAGASVLIKLAYWTDGSTQGTSQYLQFLIGVGETVNFPMSRVIISQDADTMYNGTKLDQAAPNSNMYIDSTVDSNDGTGDDITGSASVTNLILESDNDTNFFHVGDLIRVNNEIMEVTAVGDDSDAANTNLTVIRGTHGSTAASDHADDAAIRFPFFNAYHNFTAATGGYDVPQTDNDGKFKAMNFFGYGRANTLHGSGILPSSVSIKFYNAGYQELGLSGITPGTNTGLTAGTTYQFDINVDGAGDFDVQFTVDANNTNWGGRNGVLSKIQQVFNDAYYASGNLFEKKVNVGIVNGDVRFTSGQCLSSSSIALSDSSGASTDVWGVGRFPTVAKLATAVAAKLPDDTVPTAKTAESMVNESIFMFDDGEGNFVGAGTGTINYETGAVDFTAKPNAEFVVSARYGSVMTGKVSIRSANTIDDISVRSLNNLLDTMINIKVKGYPLVK